MTSRGGQPEFGAGPTAPTGGRVDAVLRPDARAPAAARALLADHVPGLSESTMGDAELLISEVVANAVMHGAPEITLTLRVTPPGVGVAVHDCGDAMPTTTDDRPGDAQVSGRGMSILAALADRWGVDPSDPAPGKTVWFTLT